MKACRRLQTASAPKVSEARIAAMAMRHCQKVGKGRAIANLVASVDLILLWNTSTIHWSPSHSTSQRIFQRQDVRVSSIFGPQVQMAHIGQACCETKFQGKALYWYVCED